MSFGNISTNSKTFADRGNGQYADNSVSFGEPSNVLKIRANTNKNAPSIVVSRTKQIDYIAVAGAAPKRITATVQLIVTIPPAGFSPAVVSDMSQDIVGFVSPSTLSEMLQGKS